MEKEEERGGRAKCSTKVREDTDLGDLRQVRCLAGLRGAVSGTARAGLCREGTEFGEKALWHGLGHESENRGLALGGSYLEDVRH